MKLENLQGLKFSYLTVIGREKNGNHGHTRWLCECECGTRKILSTVWLKRSKNPSCGCNLKKSKIKHDLMMNKKFGKLRVIELSESDFSGTRKKIMWLCECECGTRKKIDGHSLRSGHTKTCGCYRKKRKGENHPNWKGNRKKTLEGYIQIRNTSHPNSDKRGYISEHVLVMSNYLGRPIEKGEVIHHKNGIKDDNNIDNLELCTISNHFRGQRVEDMINFCLSYLNKYKPEVLNDRYNKKRKK